VRSEHFLFSDPPEHRVEVVLSPQPLSVAEAIDYYKCQVRMELVLREPKAWRLRPEN
jgi:hypothetical protein